ncbi:hypothetical protein ABH931_004647 [Streptacidiphilus sp. MAP12-33]
MWRLNGRRMFVCFGDCTGAEASWRHRSRTYEANGEEPVPQEV